MAKKVAVENLADEIMKGLNEYANSAAVEVKAAVTKAGKTVKDTIADTAPSDTGKYAKSWTVKKVSETANKLELSVHSRDRYYLAHLLEYGHAKRGGGRVPGKSHIAPAEEKALKELEETIIRTLGG